MSKLSIDFLVDTIGIKFEVDAQKKHMAEQARRDKLRRAKAGGKDAA